MSHVGAVQVHTAADETFNLWQLPVTVTDADFESVDPTVAQGARNPDGSLPTSNFLHIITGSDLIDKGTNVGLPFEGTAPDLGAYESGGTGQPVDLCPNIVGDQETMPPGMVLDGSGNCACGTP